MFDCDQQGNEQSHAMVRASVVLGIFTHIINTNENESSLTSNTHENIHAIPLCVIESQTHTHTEQKRRDGITNENKKKAQNCVEFFKI